MIEQRTAVRIAADRCPGVLRPHQAADGALVRLRLPGGVISAAALSCLLSASAAYADGRIALTSRGNLQLRAVTPDPDGEAPDGLIRAVQAAGLLPSTPHERVRNIICSPLTGRVGGLADLRPAVREFDRLLCASTELADLPGRFLFSFDDGRGDVSALRADLGLSAIGPDRVVLVVGDRTGPSCDLADAPGRLIDLAHRFLAVRGDAWHVRELPGGALGMAGQGNLETVGAPMRYGVLAQGDGRELVSTLVPLGVLTPVLAEAVLRAAGDRQLVVTPWRGIVIPDLPAGQGQPAARLLSDAGLVVVEASPWHGITACTGAPGCANAAADTGSIATELATGTGLGRLPVHVVACERRCGTPAGEHVGVLARPLEVSIRVAGVDRTVDPVALTGEVALARAAGLDTA